MTYTLTHYKLKKYDVDVVINHEEMKLPIDVFYRYKLRVGVTFDEKTYQKICDDARFSYCMQKALKLLKVPKTTYELREKLFSLTYSLPVIKQVIKELETKGYLNDEMYMKTYHELRPSTGPKKLEFIFKRKGISHERIETFIASIDEHASLEIAFLKVIRKPSNRSFQKTKESIYHHLLSQGFSSSKIFSILDQRLNKNEEKEREALHTLFQKTYPKLKGNAYEKCQLWIKKALSKGFNYKDAKHKCEEIQHANMD